MVATSKYVEVRGGSRLGEATLFARIVVSSIPIGCILGPPEGTIYAQEWVTMPLCS